MNIITLNQVEKKVKKRLLLHEVNATIPKGSITVLVGINGSGKTLILKAILGLISVTGEVLVCGKKMSVKNSYPIKAGILIENPSLIDDFNAYRNLELLAKLDPEIKEKEITKLLNYFDLNRFPKQKVKKFSLGMKQKLGIAQAFLGGYPLIVLDEPTNALDHESKEKLVSLITEYNNSGSTFIIASHDKTFIDSIATQKLYVQEGTITYEK